MRSRLNAILEVLNTQMDTLDAIVEELRIVNSGNGDASRKAAVKKDRKAAMEAVNSGLREMWDMSGKTGTWRALALQSRLMEDIVRVISTDGSAYKEARFWALRAAVGMCSDNINDGGFNVLGKKRLFELEGFLGCLIRTMGRDGKGYSHEVEKKKALEIIKNISSSTGLHKLFVKNESLVECLVSMVNQEDSDQSESRQNSMECIYNVARGSKFKKSESESDDEVLGALYNFPNMIPTLLSLVSDKSLADSKLFTWASLITVALVNWQHRSFRGTFETYTIALKLCSTKKAPRAHPTSVLANFFHDNKDVASHILTFLESKKVHHREAMSRMREDNVFIWKPRRDGDVREKLRESFKF